MPGTEQTVELDVEPCKRYCFNARFRSSIGDEWKPVLTLVETIPGCKLPAAKQPRVLASRDSFAERGGLAATSLANAHLVCGAAHLQRPPASYLRKSSGSARDFRHFGFYVRLSAW